MSDLWSDKDEKEQIKERNGNFYEALYASPEDKSEYHQFNNFFAHEVKRVEAKKLKKIQDKKYKQEKKKGKK